MKMKWMVTLLALAAFGSAHFDAKAMEVTNSLDNKSHVSDLYNTKAFFDREKEINQGKDIIIHY